MPIPDLILYQKRVSKRFTEGGKCSRCGRPAQTLWYYRESSHGEVYLCEDCKRELLSKMDGHDALDHRHEGGAFEMNRHRH